MATNEDSGLWMFAFIILIIGGISWIIWANFKMPLTKALLELRNGQLAVASLWTDDDKDVVITKREQIVNQDPLYNPEITAGQFKVTTSTVSFAAVKDLVSKVKPDQALAAEGFITAATQAALAPFKWIFTGLLGFFALYVTFRGPTSQFRRRLNFEGLIKEHAKSFWYTLPFVNFNPLKLASRSVGAPVSQKLEPFSEALSPEEFIAYNNIRVQNDPVKKERLVHVEDSLAAFKKQLIGPWRGWQYQAPPIQILIAAFCMKAARLRDESDKIMARLSTCWSYEKGMVLSHDRGLLGEARKFLKSKQAEDALKIMQRHAYVATAMVRLLQYARAEGGVLAPAQFLWLRGYNRALWYPLNNIGRQAYHTEALGALAHFRAEKMVNRPIMKPFMEEAVRGLNQHLASPYFSKPIPDKAA